MDDLTICKPVTKFGTYFFDFSCEFNRSQVVQKNAHVDEIDAYKSSIPEEGIKAAQYGPSPQRKKCTSH